MRSPLVAAALAALSGLVLTDSSGSRPSAAPSIREVAACLIRSGKPDKVDWHVRGGGQLGWARGIGIRPTYGDPYFLSTRGAGRGWVTARFPGDGPWLGVDLAFGRSESGALSLARAAGRELGVGVVTRERTVVGSWEWVATAGVRYRHGGYFATVDLCLPGRQLLHRDVEE